MARFGAVLVVAAGLGAVGQSGVMAASQGLPAPLGPAAGTATNLLPAPPPPPSAPAVATSVLPTPVKAVVGTVTGTVTGTLAKVAGAVPRSQPAASHPASQPASHHAPSPSSKGGSTTSPNPPSNHVAQAGTSPATGKDTVVGADVSVRDLLGACVRLTKSGVPAQATVVVLDRNLIGQLKAVGLPVDKLVVPCPAGAAVGSPGSTPGAGAGATSAADTSANGSGDPQSGAGGPLAFTGTELAATLLLAGGLVALGIAFLRKARALVPALATRGGR